MTKDSVTITPNDGECC